LLQDEIDEEDTEEEEEMEDEMKRPMACQTQMPLAPPVGESEETRKNSEATLPMDEATILANKKASPYFRGLHRSKGVFWLVTRPNQQGYWSTAGAMLTLGSEMPWLCCVDKEEWNAEEDMKKAIIRDFEGEWGDRRQEIVLIGEQLNTKGLTRLLDGCLLSCVKMRKWEHIMHDKNLSENDKDAKLSDIWDDGY
jgi:G3E family GTPase